MAQIEQTITTLEIAEMMEMRHDRVLRKLEGQDVKGKHTEGIIEILTHHNLGASDYFIPSTYKDESGKENKCYKVTKLNLYSEFEELLFSCCAKNNDFYMTEGEKLAIEIMKGSYIPKV